MSTFQIGIHYMPRSVQHTVRRTRVKITKKNKSSFTVAGLCAYYFHGFTMQRWAHIQGQ